MKHETIDFWLREKRSHSIVLRAAEDGRIEAIGFDALNKQTQTIGEHSAASLELLSIDFECMRPSPTVPCNPTVDDELPTLRPTVEATNA